MQEIPKKIGRGGQSKSIIKNAPKSHNQTKSRQIQARGKKGKTKVTEEKAQTMSPKLALPDPKDGKEKPSRNLEMEGQRVRTINPSRKNRNASARQLQGASKAEAKRSCSQKTALTNTQLKRRQDKTET